MTLRCAYGSRKCLRAVVLFDHAKRTPLTVKCAVHRVKFASMMSPCPVDIVQRPALLLLKVASGGVDHLGHFQRRMHMDCCASQFLRKDGGR
jgi:hypothetical protein